MEYFQLINHRRSIRRYKPDAIPEDDIMALLEAARLAPSWANRQCWRFIVVTDQDIKERIAGGDRQWISQAPIIIVACADPTASGRKPNMEYYMLDIGISFEHLILAATDLGLGTCWIGSFDEDSVKKALEVPDAIRVVAFTPVGYPDEKKGRVFARKPLREICFKEKFGRSEPSFLADTIIDSVTGVYIKGRKFAEKLRNLFPA